MRVAALILGAALVALPVVAEVIPEPDGYREEEYRAPVPATLTGATVIDGDAAYALWKTDRVAFVDVLPRAPRPDNLPEGTVFRETPRQSIPGAVWLPNVGYGALAEETLTYLRNGLDAATGGDSSHPVVLFCLTDCWMSWNAAKRIQDFGYDRVFWFPGGTDAWELSGYPTELVEPYVR